MPIRRSCVATPSPAADSYRRSTTRRRRAEARSSSRALGRQGHAAVAQRFLPSRPHVREQELSTESPAGLDRGARRTLTLDGHVLPRARRAGGASCRSRRAAGGLGAAGPPLFGLQTGGAGG